VLRSCYFLLQFSIKNCAGGTKLILKPDTLAAAIDLQPCFVCQDVADVRPLPFSATAADFTITTFMQNPTERFRVRIVVETPNGLHASIDGPDREFLPATLTRSDSIRFLTP
jgi:hypothetical protein